MITIREATKNDIDKLYELIIAIAKFHNQEKYVITNKEELLKSGFGITQKFGVLLAEKDGMTAGYVSYTWNYSIWLGSKYMNIDDVFVWEKFRGLKIGEQLMQKAKEVGLNNKVSMIKWEVQKENFKAIKFYERLGAKIDVKGVVRWDLTN